MPAMHVAVPRQSRCLPSASILLTPGSLADASLVAKNYASAFNGNRQLTSHNTDDLFRNRLAILDAMAADANNEVEVAYVEAIKQRERLALYAAA